MAGDDALLHRIRALIDEEHELRDALGRGSITAGEEQQRLHRLEVELDQCWDLLRQRRARREFGRNPDEAQVRPEGTVEGYME